MELLLAVLLINGIVHASGDSSASESALRKLRHHLLDNYDVNTRPVPHHDNLTEVQVGVSPLHITQVNENTGIMTIESWVAMSWKDSHLKWNPAEFDGLDVIRLPEKDVWKPDISVYNGRGDNVAPWYPVKLLVYSDGSVTWIPAASLNFICGDFDYTSYPHDTQECNLTLGTWTEDADHLDVKLGPDNHTLDDYHSAHNPHWELLSLTGKKKVLRYDCCSEQYSTLVFKVKIMRVHVSSKALYATLDTAARVLILLMFWISSAIGKVLLGCTSLLLFTVLAVGVTVTLPTPAAAPPALAPVSSAIALCVAAMVIELLVISMSTLSISSPSFFDRISSSTFCQLLTPCHNEEYKEDLMETNASSPKKKSKWPLLATIIDRAAFLVFAVLLSAV